MITIIKKMIEKTIHDLNAKYEDKPIHISKVASGYRFQVKPGMEEYISKLKDKGTNKFSKAFYGNNCYHCIQTTSNPW